MEELRRIGRFRPRAPGGPSGTDRRACASSNTSSSLGPIKPGPVAPVVHPLSIRTAGLRPGRQLQPGLSAAPETNYLPLLPSGPDGVRSVSPRRARLSTLTYREQSPRTQDLEREFNPAIADCGYRAPLAPRLARPLTSYHDYVRPCQGAHKCTENTTSPP